MKTIEAKKINEKRKVLKFMNDEYCIVDNNQKRISRIYNYIDNFYYNKDVNELIALAKIKIRSSRKKDTLIGYINADGKFISNIYSVYFNELYDISDNEVDDLIRSIYNQLSYESNYEEKNEKSAIVKMKLLLNKKMFP